MKDLYIVGAGGFGREVAWLAERINQISPTWNIKGFIDDNVQLHGQVIGSYKVLGSSTYLSTLATEIWVVCAIGSPKIREMVVKNMQEFDNIKFATLIDPSVILSESVKIGEGSILCAGTVLTVNISIGCHVHINLNCTVGHDAVIDDFVTIYPGVCVSGNVSVSKNVEVGTGASIIQGKSISEGAIIGAGAVVVKNIIESGTYVGVPAERRA